MILPRIRTIKEAYAEIKEADPKTAIAQTYIRRIVPTLPSTIKVGNRFLVNMDELEEYLANPNRGELDRLREYRQAGRKIRAVAE